MHLTIFTDYGLRSLMYLAARPDKICSVREISDYYGISRNHLVKVIHCLSQLGYITSSKGKGGGIMLSCPAETIRMGDVVQKLEPHMHVVECFSPGANTCRLTGACQLKHYLHEANTTFIHTLNKYTLADAVKHKELFPA